MKTKSNKSVLPYDGTVVYLGKILTDTEAWHFYERFLHTLAWKNDGAIIFGKHVVTKRKACWYGDLPYDYTYSNHTKQAVFWTPELLDLKRIVEKKQPQGLTPVC